MQEARVHAALFCGGHGREALAVLVQDAPNSLLCKYADVLFDVDRILAANVLQGADHDVGVLRQEVAKSHVDARADVRNQGKLVERGC